MYRSQDLSYKDLRADLDFTNLVFVYGTLKAGRWNNRLLSSSLFAFDATTDDKFLLVDCGFPYAIPRTAAESAKESLLRPVRGEVYQIQDARVLANLDALEGHPWHYYRTPVYAEGMPVWMYNMTDDVSDTLPLCPVNAEGAYEWYGN